MFSRRELTLSAAFTFAPPAFAQSASPAPEDAKLTALFDVFFQEDLRENPEGATQLGLDTGANADLKAKLRDDSAAASRTIGLTAPAL